MNIATLVEICRPGELPNYILEDDVSERIDKVENNIVKQYELIESSISASGSSSYLNGLNAEYIIKNKNTGKLYRITTTHESWTESLIESFVSAEIFEIIPVEKTIILYEDVKEEYLGYI